MKKMKPYWEILSQWFKTHSSIHLSCIGLNSGLPIEKLEHEVLAWHITATPIKILDYFLSQNEEEMDMKQ